MILFLSSKYEIENLDHGLRYERYNAKIGILLTSTMNSLADHESAK